LHQTFKNNPALTNDTLIDLVILKGLHDAFYTGIISEYRSFPKKQLIMTLDSMICCAMTPEFKMIAKNIKEKVSQMMPGTEAPSFSLLNLDSVPISLSEFRGKYLYLNFFDIRSYSFLNELSLLSNISKKFPKELDVITIICNGNVSQAKELIQKNDYKWHFLISENPKKIISNYNIKVLPGFYLIDPYGKIILAPAPGPDNNFEKIFSTILSGRN
jgi:peroxiredoxin